MLLSYVWTVTCELTPTVHKYVRTCVYSMYAHISQYYVTQDEKTGLIILCAQNISFI